MAGQASTAAAGPDRRAGVPDPGVEGTDTARGGPAAGRTGPGRVLDPRGVPRRLPATRGLRPGVPRRRRPDPGRPVPRPQEPGGVRLRPRPRPQTRPDRPPRHPGLRHRQGERAAPRTARHRQDPPRHRARRSGPAKPGTGSCSPPPPNGSPASPTPTTPAGSKTSWSASAATRCWSSTRSATSPSKPEAANLFFQLVSSRYERASLIVTSNKPFGRWGEVFGDEVVAAAMIDRLVHHAEVIALKGDSYRLKNRDLGRVPRPPPPTTDTTGEGSTFNRRQGVHFQPPLTGQSRRSLTVGRGRQQ